MQCEGWIHKVGSPYYFAIWCVIVVELIINDNVVAVFSFFHKNNVCPQIKLNPSILLRFCPFSVGMLDLTHLSRSIPYLLHLMKRS